MRLNKPIIAVSAVAMLALAACGGAGDDGGGDGGEETFKEGGGVGAGMDPNREGPAEIEGAKKGGTIQVVSVAGLNTMDPTEAYYTNTYSILGGLVTRSLTQYVYDPDTEDMVLVPDLATDLGTSNEDFTEWTFEIREGIKYENGQPVTADDVAFGIKRSFDRDTFPEGADYSNQYMLDGDTYKGPYSSPNDEYAGVTVDGNKLTIKMAKPFPDMPYWGAFPAMGPIPEGPASDPTKYAAHPWATGPYMFGKYVPEKSLELVKNPNWDPATDPGRTQYADKYEMRFDVESTKIDQILLKDQGEAQTTLSLDSVLVANYLKAKQDAADRLVTGANPCTFMWYPDYTKITDINIRKALAYAYPYKASYSAGGYIEGVNRIPGSNIMPPGIPGREEYNPLGEDYEIGSTDPAKAKELLEQAGAVGYEISFLYSTDVPESVDVKDAIAKALTEVGFTPKPYATTSADSSTLRADPKTPINVRSGGWCSDWPSGSSWFPPVFQLEDPEILGANYASFSEPAVDEEIDRILQLPLEEQPAAWNDLDQMIMEEYFPVFVTAYGGEALMHGSKIEGFAIDGTTGMPAWKNIWANS
jgi:peptide/nickel transport system substrate-binding protein